MVAKREGVCGRCGKDAWVFHTGKRWICFECWIELFPKSPGA